MIRLGIARVAFSGTVSAGTLRSHAVPNIRPATPDAAALGPVLPTATKSASIVSGSDSFTFDITDPEVDYSDLTQIDWQPVSHPNSKPWLVKAGAKLKKLTFKGKMYQGGAPLGRRASNLVYMSTLLTPVTFVYGEMETGLYRITDIGIRIVNREPGTNEVTEFDFNLELTEANDPPIPKPVPTAPAPVPPAPPTPAASPPVAPHYIVKKGDTLWAIATKYYHNGSAWPRIADANGIKDPRKLAIGTNLVIP